MKSAVLSLCFFVAFIGLSNAQQKKEAEGRPAMLYRYRDDAVAEVKTRRLFP